MEQMFPVWPCCDTASCYNNDNSGDVLKFIRVFATNFMQTSVSKFDPTFSYAC